MHQRKDGILANLGLTEEALVSARALDAELDEMCRDLEELEQAFDLTPNKKSTPSGETPDQHLIRLICELETEVRLRLSAIKPPEPTPGQDVKQD